MKLAYAAYAVIGTLSFAVFARSLPLFLDPYPAPSIDPAGGAAAVYEPLLAITGAFTILAAAAFVGIGLFVLRARPTDRFALLVSLGAVVLGLGMVSGGQLAWVEPAWAAPVRGLIYVGNVLALAVILTLPDGRFVPRQAVAILALAIPWQGSAWLVFSVLRPSERPDPLFDPCYCTTAGIAVLLAFLVTGLATQVYRYRSVATPRQRDQMKWITFGVSLWVVAIALVRVVITLWPDESAALGRWAGLAAIEIGPDPLGLFAVSGATILLRVAQVSVVVAFAVAILRTRLLEIDLIINRTLLYAAITLVLLAVFAAVSSLAQLAIENAGARGSGVLTVAIAAATALGFGPLRARMAPLVDRLLPARASVTLLFLDIVGSTERAVAVGDERWREIHDLFVVAVRREIARHRGREVDNAGDSFFVVFGDARQALTAAAAIRDALRKLALDVRIGVHVGECQMRGEKPTGVAVHAAARVMAFAAAGEIYVSADAGATLKDAGVTLFDRGLHPLKGVPGEWRLYVAESP